jgi:hypothetical protein
MKRVTVSVPDDLDALVREWAEETGKSLSEVYAEAVEEHVREQRRRNAARRVATILERTTVEPGAIDELHRERDASDRPPSS